MPRQGASSKAHPQSSRKSWSKAWSSSSFRVMMAPEALGLVASRGQHKCAQAPGQGGHCPSAWPHPLTPCPA